MATSRDWTVPVIGAVAAMVIVGGCSAKRVETPTFGATPTVTTTAIPTAPTKPAGPTKYTFAKVQSCLEIKQEVGGDLPSSQPDDDQKIGNSSSRACTFKSGDSAVVFRIRSWENTDDAAGVKAGAEYATEYFTDRTKDWQQDTGANIGSDARWRAKNPAACALEILDENGVLIVSRTSGTAIDEEQCRVGVRELAKKFFAAVQP